MGCQSLKQSTFNQIKLSKLEKYLSGQNPELGDVSLINGKQLRII